jgi:hypothetical protein
MSLAKFNFFKKKVFANSRIREVNQKRSRAGEVGSEPLVKPAPESSPGNWKR